MNYVCFFLILPPKTEKRNIMELVPLKPRRGEGTFRIDDSDDFVVIESLGQFPSNGLFPESGVYIENHGVIVICTEGMAQFEHDGQARATSISVRCSRDRM